MEGRLFEPIFAGMPFARQKPMHACTIRDITITIAGAPVCGFLLVGLPHAALAQMPAESAQNQTASGSARMNDWQLMQDGVAFFTFNRQGGARGGREFKS